MLNEIANDQDFPKLTGGLDKGRTGQRRIRYPYFQYEPTQQSQSNILALQDQQLSKSI